MAKVLDSTFLIDVIRGKNETKKVLGEKELFTTQINLYEVVRGLFLRNVSTSKVQETLLVLSDVKTLPLDDDALLLSAEISANLIKMGVAVDDADCLIAGMALSKGVNTIVTRNREHFSRIPEIKVETY
ncbi:type II toxin-antitoxin system VapC family toxin [Candidatus Woesearchaeota archaeon]|nr:type II toxin-antitoxin system VapC family toxin [Candidatus Woesearchaeota archaeon]